MQVTILGQHAPFAPLLQGLLGPDHTVEGFSHWPATERLATDVLVTTKLSAQDAARLDCRLVQTPSAGVDAIAAEALPEDCPLCNVYEHQVPIAEFIAHAVLDYCIYPNPNPPPLDEEHWPAQYLGRAFHGEVQGQHAAIVGLGAIGKEAARRLRALGMRVTAVTRRQTPEPDVDATHPVERLIDLLHSVDVLVLCCPLNDATRGMIGDEAFRALKSSALLINVGRAELIHEQALFDALQQNRLGRAVLDVWYRYPSPGQTRLAPASLPFHTLANVRATPHMAGWTRGMIERRYAFIARNIERLAAGEPLQNILRGQQPHGR
jgi:phosphoglycerate dehydrogenase-like enzyme